jgi:hypothetical protein
MSSSSGLKDLNMEALCFSKTCLSTNPRDVAIQKTNIEIFAAVRISGANFCVTQVLEMDSYKFRHTKSETRI